jgi:tetratricopeptide (TPR) repeat protein
VLAAEHGLERGVMKQLSSVAVMTVFSLACAANSAAQNKPANVTDVRAVTKEPAEHSSAAKSPAQLFFGTFPVSTRSVEARTLAEKALNNYENVQLDECIADAKKAADKDPQFALAYAIWSFAARRDEPASGALAKASALAASAPPEEQLLVRWMVATQSSDLLPAISLMNDMLKRFPDNKHILYLSAEWLYFQQDYDRARKLFEKALQNDPNFPPSLNMLGYAYIETGDPDPAKAEAALARYAELLPDQPNPHDSLGEVLRFAGDDEAALVEYHKALKISPTFYSSQLGVAETLTLMGQYDQARGEMDKAVAIAPTTRDKLHIEFQKVLIRFWEGKPELGRTELAALEQKALNANDGYAQYDVGLGGALLAATPDEQLAQLTKLENTFSHPFNAMVEGDRHTALAAILREKVRLLSQMGQVESAQHEIQELETLARDTRDAIIQNCYDSARGYAFYATGDYANAADELSSDPQNPLVAWQLVLAYEKLGNNAQAEVDRNRWKYLRADTPQWFLTLKAAAN